MKKKLKTNHSVFLHPIGIMGSHCRLLIHKTYTVYRFKLPVLTELTLSIPVIGGI